MDMFAGLVVGRLVDKFSGVATFMLVLNVFQVITCFGKRAIISYK